MVPPIGAKSMDARAEVGAKVDGMAFPHGGANGDGHHNQQTLAAALARGGVPPEGVGQVATPGFE